MLPRNFSCSGVKDLVLICLSLIVCVFLVDFFLFPILPRVPQHMIAFPSTEPGIPKFHDYLEDVLSSQASDLVKGVGGSFSYRNATWRPGIGEWIAQFRESPLISISERLHNKACEDDCGERGVCNRDLGKCRCFHGYAGEGCGRQVDFPCKIGERTRRVSLCGATCEKTTSFCFCGEGTKYPQRPASEACGFLLEDGVTNWNVRDPQIFSNSSIEPGGWCNLDPTDYLATTSKKRTCYCTYDGTGGEFCEKHVESVCVNQCAGNGQCRGGFCDCLKGWHGIDCSVPSLLSSFKRWPTWLLPVVAWKNTSSVAAATPDSRQPQQLTLELTVKKRRPLIYIYDLPPKFNSHLLEGRHFRYWCSTRIYNEQNITYWTGNLYGSESALLESLLSSPHRTTNAEEADFFYVPSLEACAHTQADSAPHTDMQREYMGLRTYFSGDFHKRAYEHIKQEYPYWNRSAGRDHIWLFPWDEGACSAPKEIWNSIMLVHWGNTNSKHNYSTTAYPADDWTDIPSEWRGNHPCYDPDKDLVLPAWKKPDPLLILEKLWARPRDERPTLFYFNGNLGDLYEGGRPEESYSMGLRQALAAEFASVPNKKGELGRQVAPDVTVVSKKTEEYGYELSQSRFCGVFPGDGWSGRMEDSILHGCIPVIVQDGIHLPYENVLDYDAFAVRIAEDDLPRLVQILRGLNDSTVDSMIATIQGMWQRFTYHTAVKQEAERQKLLHKREELWAREYKSLDQDDVFDTFIQVLYFKLCNSPWRTNSKDGKRGINNMVRESCKNQSHRH